MLIIKWDDSAASTEQALSKRSLDNCRSLNVAACLDSIFYFRQRWWESLRKEKDETHRSQSHCVQTSVCFVESSRYSAHISSALWTGLSFKKSQWWSFLFSLVLCLFHSFSTFCLCSRHTLFTPSPSFMQPFIHSSSHCAPSWPPPLFMCLLYPPSILYFFVLSIFSRKTQTSAGVRTQRQVMCVFQEKGGETMRNIHLKSVNPTFYLQINYIMLLL